MICAQLQTITGATGRISVFTPLDPQPSNITSCTYVITSGAEVSAFPPLNATQGSQIALAIGLCWAAAYTFRVLGQFLNSSSQERE